MEERLNQWYFIRIEVSRDYLRGKKIFLTEPTKVTESIDFINPFLCVLRVLCEKFIFLHSLYD